MKITFIGSGNMASALIGGLISRGHPATDILAIDPSETAREKVTNLHGVSTLEQATVQAIAGSTCVLAVKPQLMKQVATGLAPLLSNNPMISVAAGIRIADIGRWLGGHDRIVRAMPNTPALIGQGVTGLYCSPDSADATGDRESAETILGAVGATLWVDSELALDAVTAISGSGPAYVFRWMEALLTAGAELGLNAEQVKTLVEHTVRGAAELAMRADEPVSTLRENVTSKGGTTAAGLDAMNAAGVESAIISGVKAAHARSVEMGDEFGAE
ncbi:MAG: pyrroline-5-carboxylate reductase [Burkholderiaceae bacterium]